MFGRHRRSVQLFGVMVLALTAVLEGQPTTDGNTGWLDADPSSRFVFSFTSFATFGLTRPAMSSMPPPD